MAAVSSWQLVLKARLTHLNALPVTAIETSTGKKQMIHQQPHRQQQPEEELERCFSTEDIILITNTTILTRFHHLLPTTGPQLGTFYLLLRRKDHWHCHLLPTEKIKRISPTQTAPAGHRERGTELSSLKTKRIECWSWPRVWGGGFKSMMRLWCTSSAMILESNAMYLRFGCITTSTLSVRNPRYTIWRRFAS